MFNDMETFTEFRSTLWPDDPIGTRFFLEWASQRTLERRLEAHYRLPPKSLEGVCLIFGTQSELKDRLTNPETRDIILNPETEVILKITTADFRVHSSTRCRPVTYGFDYPAQEALIPPDTPLFQSYFEFSAQRVTEIEGDVMMVYPQRIDELRRNVEAAHERMGGPGEVGSP
jgi:hypothetical protein